MQDAWQAEEILAAEAGIAVLGKVALANPIFPNRVRATQETDAFTPAILGSIATIKPSEPAARAMRPDGRHPFREHPSPAPTNVEHGP